jgi:hypothetical protein
MTFINFSASKQSYGVASESLGRATTLAIGEEGGGPSTMMNGEEGGQCITAALNEGGGIDITTYAHGEEGGISITMHSNENGGSLPVATLCGNEDGGPITTQAIGEEGGENITSMAFGEEGGGHTTMCGNEDGGWQKPASTRTQEYIDFQREADARGNGNGRLTRQEATNQVDVYKRQIKVIDQLSQRLGWSNPQYANFFNSLKEKLQAKVNVGNRLLNNFDQFARGGGWNTRLGDDPSTVSITDIQKLSEKDGNKYNVSDTDLGINYLFCGNE